MLLSLRPLIDVCSVNVFSPAKQVSFTEGDQTTLYFQLVNLAVDRSDQGFSPAGRRYIPAVGATVNFQFGNIDDAKKVSRAAFQPFAQDSSIWAVNVLSSDPIVGTCNIRVTLTEGSTITHGLVQAAVDVAPATELF